MNKFTTYTRDIFQMILSKGKGKKPLSEYDKIVLEFNAMFLKHPFKA